MKKSIIRTIVNSTMADRPNREDRLTIQHRESMNRERTIRKLTQLKLEEPGIVAKLKLPESEAQRLDELGLHIGSSVRVLAGTTNESILIAVGDSRIGVNFDVAQRIYVY